MADAIDRKTYYRTRKDVRTSHGNLRETKRDIEAALAANPKLRLPATPKAVERARDVEGLRWLAVSVYTGKTESACRALYDEAKEAPGAAVSDYVGRGRRWERMTTERGTVLPAIEAARKLEEEAAAKRAARKAARAEREAAAKVAEAVAESAEPVDARESAWAAPVEPRDEEAPIA
jgi:hypothetical protein